MPRSIEILEYRGGVLEQNDIDEIESDGVILVSGPAMIHTSAEFEPTCAVFNYLDGLPVKWERSVFHTQN